MVQEESEKAENLRVLLEQYWLQCRHIESERQWFMNVYTVIAGGLVAYYFTGYVRESWLLYFLMVLTVIGFLLTWRWKQAFQYLLEQAEKTADKLGVPVDFKIPANWFWKIFGTRFLFLYFYAIVFAGLIILLMLNRGCIS